MIEEEKLALCKFINTALAVSEPCAQHLPLSTDPASDDLFSRLGDGFILCGLLNLAPNCGLSERALQRDVHTAYGEAPLTDDQRRENLKLVLGAVREQREAQGGQEEEGEGGAGAITAEVILEGSDHTAILGLLWDILRLAVVHDISIHNFPELVLLLDDDEEMDSLLFMPPQQVLLRWINYHLDKADDYRARRLSDWTEDLRDSEIYALLLQQLCTGAGAGCSVDVSLLEFGYTCRLSPEEKARVVLGAAKQLLSSSSPPSKMPLVLRAENIVSGHAALNVLFAGQLFRAFSGLTLNQHVREHVKESISELVAMQKEAEEQERLEAERVAREKREQEELEIALEKERQFRELEAQEEAAAALVREEERRAKEAAEEAARVAARELEEQLELAKEKERQHRELEKEEEAREAARVAAREQERVREQEAAAAALATKQREEEEEMQREAINKLALQRHDEDQEKEEGGNLSNSNIPPSTAGTTLQQEKEQEKEKGEEVRVVEEAWENQTYLPVRGWGVPISSSGLPPFSDRAGTKKFTFEKYPAVAGWEWLAPESDAWQVDHSRSFGDTDDEGWCYDTSFDKILEALRLGATSRENKTTNLARRRRLLRHPQALAEHHAHLGYLSQQKAALEGALETRQEEFLQLSQLETKRAEEQAEARAEALGAVGGGHACFLEFRAELSQLEKFLQAQAAAELLYADRLEEQHRLFLPLVDEGDGDDPGSGGGVGDREKREVDKEAGNSPRMRAISITREYLKLKDDSSSLHTPSDQGKVNNKAMTVNVKKASFQFFYGFSEFNSSSANKHRDLGNFLEGSVLADVRGLAMELDAALAAAKQHLGGAEEHRALAAELAAALTALQRAHSIGARKSQTKLNNLNAKIRGGDVVDSFASSLSSSSAGEETDDSKDQSGVSGVHDDDKDDRGGKELEEATGRGSYNTRPSSDFSFKPSSSSSDQDEHLCLRRYQALAEQYAARLVALQEAAATCSAQIKDFSLKIRQIFVISMQLCCHEKSKICSFNADLMQETSSQFQVWNNAVNEKEFQVQNSEECEKGDIKCKSHAMLPPVNDAEDISLASDDQSDGNKEPLSGNVGAPRVLPASSSSSSVSALLALGGGQLLLQDDMRFTTFADARQIAQGELDGLAPTVLDDTLHMTPSQVGFGDKGGGGGGSSRRKKSLHIPTHTPSSTETAAAPSQTITPVVEKVSTKSRFSSFFSSKHKDEPSQQLGTGTGSEEGGRRKSLVESLVGSVGGDKSKDKAEPPKDSEDHIDPPSSSTACLCASRAVVTSEGVLHLYGAREGGQGGNSLDCRSTSPLKSVSLEDSQVIFHDNSSSKHLSFAIEIYPKRLVGGKRLGDGVVLLPGSKAAALRWLAVLCSPSCGAELLVPLSGLHVEIASFDHSATAAGTSGHHAHAHSSGSQGGGELCGDMEASSFITYAPEALKPTFED